MSKIIPDCKERYENSDVDAILSKCVGQNSDGLKEKIEKLSSFGKSTDSKFEDKTRKMIPELRQCYSKIAQEQKEINLSQIAEKCFLSVTEHVINSNNNLWIIKRE